MRTCTSTSTTNCTDVVQVCATVVSHQTQRTQELFRERVEPSRSTHSPAHAHPTAQPHTDTLCTTLIDSLASACTTLIVPPAPSHNVTVAAASGPGSNDAHQVRTQDEPNKCLEPAACLPFSHSTRSHADAHVMLSPTAMSTKQRLWPWSTPRTGRQLVSSAVTPQR